MTHGLASERSNFNLMMDLNRCMILTTALPAKRFNMDSYFTTLVYSLCEIVPQLFEERIRLNMQNTEKFVRQRQDSGLSGAEEKRVLVGAILNQV